MTLPFDMEVYTKQLVRSNSHNVGSRESNSTSCRSINFRRNWVMSATQFPLPNHLFVPVLNPLDQKIVHSCIHRHIITVFQPSVTTKSIVVLSRTNSPTFCLNHNSIGLAILILAGLQYGRTAGNNLLISRNLKAALNGRKMNKLNFSRALLTMPNR